jgi:lincosamide nucleotidyltransferase A/C/D/E
MAAGAVVDLLRLCYRSGVDVWLDGGWAVDAVLGEQTRIHKDLDIIVPLSDLETLRQVLENRGFVIEDGGTDSNIVFADETGLEIDVHVITFDAAGNGLYRMADGSDWTFPAEGFIGRSAVGGFGVRCLSPEVQVLCHAEGYVPTEKDLKDMERLQARFGVELPPHLRRESERAG